MMECDPAFFKGGGAGRRRRGRFHMMESILSPRRGQRREALLLSAPAAVFALAQDAQG
jgi:hypothetical protein